MFLSTLHSGKWNYWIYCFKTTQHAMMAILDSQQYPGKFCLKTIKRNIVFSCGSSTKVICAENLL